MKHRKNTMQSFMDNQHIKIGCVAPGTLVGLKMWFTYQYSYYDPDNITVGSFSLTK